MGLKETIGKEIIVAMKAKDAAATETLRSIKTAISNFETSKDATGEITEDQGLTILNKLVKQRTDSAEIFAEQGRHELADKEIEEIKIIQKFLPEQMSEDEVREVILGIIAEVSATSIKDMGKVMGKANQVLKGKATGKVISGIVKEELK